MATDRLIKRHCRPEEDNEQKSLTSPVTSFRKLPRELQIYIFSFFAHEDLCKTVAPVCTEWWTLSKDPLLWKSLDISVETRYDTKKLAVLLQRCPMLKELKISSQYCLIQFALNSSACPMLKHLFLKNCKYVDNRILSLIIENCPLIEELNVARCGRVAKNAVSTIVSLTHLRVLNLEHCHFINDECIQLITEKCVHLEDLNILHLCRITDKSICKVSESLNSTLVRLVLGNGKKLTDMAFSKIGLCTKLQYLEIHGGELALTDETLGYLKMLTNLKVLKLHYVLSSPEIVFVNDFFLGPHVQNLVELELWSAEVNDYGVYNITVSCKLLKTLKLRFCWKVTEVGLEHIVEGCCRLNSLECLSLDHITGKCLQLIPEKLSFLTYLELSLCKKIDVSAINDLAVRMPKLKIVFPTRNYFLYKY